MVDKGQYRCRDRRWAFSYANVSMAVVQGHLC
jgi:hypothetical protein